MGTHRRSYEKKGNHINLFGGNKSQNSTKTTRRGSRFSCRHYFSFSSISFFLFLHRRCCRPPVFIPHLYSCLLIILIFFIFFSFSSSAVTVAWVSFAGEHSEGSGGVCGLSGLGSQPDGRSLKFWRRQGGGSTHAGGKEVSALLVSGGGRENRPALGIIMGAPW